MATDRAESLHTILKESLLQLDNDVIADRTLKLEKIRKLRENIFNIDGNNDINDQNNQNTDSNGNVKMEGNVGDYYIDTGSGSGTGSGIARDDPMLAWASLHQAAGLREVD